MRWQVSIIVTCRKRDGDNLNGNLDRVDIRRDVYLAYSVRATAGHHDNRPLIARIVELRRARAALLGFGNFADLVLEDRMAHTGERALGFLEDLKAKTERRFHEENRELLEFRRSLEGAVGRDPDPNALLVRSGLA